MSHARQSLMEAIYAALMADGELDAVLAGGKVFDHVPRAAGYPFVSFGEFQSEAADGDAVPAEEHRFEIHVHSRAAGRAEASAIAARVGTLIDGVPLALAEAALVYVRLADTAVAASRDRNAYEVRMRFVALTQAT
ncbi:MAG: hypothetical protein AcusKO_26400 [Acuticoccus sp.]